MRKIKIGGSEINYQPNLKSITQKPKNKVFATNKLRFLQQIGIILLETPKMLTDDLLKKKKKKIFE